MWLSSLLGSHSGWRGSFVYHRMGTAYLLGCLCYISLCIFSFSLADLKTSRELRPDQLLPHQAFLKLISY